MSSVKLSKLRHSGFSLVEVALAIGVVAFAFVSMLALLPTGLGTFRRAIDTSVAAQISQRVINDAQQADFDILIDQANLPANLEGFSFVGPRVKDPALRYFDEQGNEVRPTGKGGLSDQEQLRVIYHVNTRVTPRAPLPKTDPTAAPEHLALVTVQVAHNPNNRPIPIKEVSGDGNRLFDPATPGISIQTFSALVGRNQ